MVLENYCIKYFYIHEGYKYSAFYCTAMDIDERKACYFYEANEKRTDCKCALKYEHGKLDKTLLRCTCDSARNNNTNEDVYEDYQFI